MRAYSDARIKDIVGRSDSHRDLVLLNAIEISDYLCRSTDVVPDIYQRTTHKDGWVALTTDLKVGERVRLIGEGEEGTHEVREVRDGAFRTDFVPAGETVFVYGREVKDFLSVDYDAISMLNVSATQELAHRVETLKTENTVLKNENTALKHRVESLEAMAAEVTQLKAAIQPLLAK
ncbi:MAG: hypothetical protein WAT39_25710 [Planctomycetota bacterium]